MTGPGNRAQITVFTSGASSNLAGGFRVRCGLCTSWEKHWQVQLAPLEQSQTFGIEVQQRQSE